MHRFLVKLFQNPEAGQQGFGSCFRDIPVLFSDDDFQFGKPMPRFGIMLAGIEQRGFFLKRCPQCRFALKDHIKDAVLLKPEVVLTQHPKLHIARDGNRAS